MQAHNSRYCDTVSRSHNRRLLARALSPWYDRAVGRRSGPSADRALGPALAPHNGETKMTKRTTTREAAATPALVAVDAEVAADNAKRNSVVKPAYKHRYAARAVEAGLKRKAAQRSTWDWLAQTIAGEALGKGDKLDVERFLALLDANGVDHSRWTNRSKGWEGRLRMTGRLALQRVVAEAGILRTADGDELEAPAEWVAKYHH